MRLASYDLESHLIQPGLLTPPLVCGSVSERVGEGRLLTRDEALQVLARLLQDAGVIVTGANIPYDFAVAANENPELLRLIFEALEQGRVHDVLTAQALDAIAGGHLFCNPLTGQPLRGKKGKKARYNLDNVTQLSLGRDNAKENDFYRNRYALLEDVPQELWPREAKQYPVDDASNTLEATEVQLGLRVGNGPACVANGNVDVAGVFNNLGDLPNQVYTHFCMHLGAVWGIRTSRERVEALSAKVEAWRKVYVERFQKKGWLRADGREDSAAVKRAVAKEYGATGKCAECGGTGRVRSRKQVECRGHKIKNRFIGCSRFQEGELRLKCVCGDTGFVEKIGGEINCKSCDGTGLDLSTAPALPLTDSGGVSTSRDTLAETGDGDLHEFADNEPDKVGNTYLPYLWQGVEYPINLRPNVLVESGRTSYDGPTQLFPRVCPACLFKLKDQACTCVRPCFKARDGYWYCSVDYSALELVTLSQVCLWVCGYSKMAETINETRDPGMLHTALGAKMIGISLESMVSLLAVKDSTAKNYRQAAKPWNFGAPGGMGAAKLVLTNRKKSAGVTEGPDGRKYAGIRFCILVGGARECGTEMITEWKGRALPPVCRACVELAEYQLKPAWFEQWPEMREYFAWVSSTLDQTGGVLPAFGPWAAEGLDGWPQRAHRVRGGLDFCSGSNTGFQGLAADGAKSALRRVTREAYLDEDSPLFGTRPIMFVHDEIFSEMPIERAHLAGPRKAQIMIEAMREWTPDVHVAAAPALCEYWYKDAEEVRDAEGKLIPWRPKDESRYL